ncbi:hypothetical protein EZV62_011271 [Acer yangbiense]|uniref:Uncharacterized protein n=1 Tax=Acer yangbiense TaxID=1000413 RepID=A0A5C7I4U3_9ROSI|nr:hypothetical protein EZV62_011271 [Acer yangbiense]
MDDLVFISDRNLSIAKAAASVFPNSLHGICMYHLDQNMKAKFKGVEVNDIFYKCSKAYRIVEFNQIMAQIRGTDTSVAQYLNEADPTKWARSHFDGRRDCIMTTNIAEYLNGILNDARELPIEGSMGNGKEHSSTLTPCSSNPPSVEFNKDRPNPQEMEDYSSRICQNIEIDGDDMIEEPKKGMEFNSLEDLLSYYKSYGKTECKAKINALRSDGKLRLTTVHNIHNHGLSPKKSRFFRCNREVSDTVKRILDTNDMAGVRMNKSFRSLVVGAGGFENLPFLEKDCHNYIDKARHLRLGAGGAGALR